MFRNFLKRKNLGVTAIEVSILLPIFLLLIFFIFELHRMLQIKEAVTMFANECAENFAISRSTSSFNVILKKYSNVLIDSDSKLIYYMNFYDDIQSVQNQLVFWDENGDGYYNGTESLLIGDYSSSSIPNISIGKKSAWINGKSRIFGNNDADKSFSSISSNDKSYVGFFVVIYKFRFLIGLFNFVFNNSFVNESGVIPIIGSAIVRLSS